MQTIDSCDFSLTVPCLHAILVLNVDLHVPLREQMSCARDINSNLFIFGV